MSKIFLRHTLTKTNILDIFLLLYLYTFSLFADKERKLGKLDGKGTLRFSITLLIGCTDFDLFFRVPDFRLYDIDQKQHQFV